MTCHWTVERKLELLEKTQTDWQNMQTHKKDRHTLAW